MVEPVQYKVDILIIHRHGELAPAMMSMPVYEARKHQRQELFDQIGHMQRVADLEPDMADRLAAGAMAAARA